jgi:Protein of unknown function (DUF3108)
MVNIPLSATRRGARWLPLLAASILLHLLVFGWADDELTPPAWQEREPAVMAAELKPLPPLTKQIEAAPPPRSVPRRRAPASAIVPAPATPARLADVTGPVGEPGAEVAGASAPPADQIASQAPVSPQPEEPAAKTPRIDLPPPAELQYDVQATRDGQSWHGSGLFRWEAEGERYSVTVEASITLLFKITVLNSKSEGRVSAIGIEPVLYSEKPFRKSMTSTHFQRDRGAITFSASEASYPYHGGEQDRASIVWQLAGMGRGDAAQFKPGAEIAVVVAGARDAEPWHIQVLGEEDIETPLGPAHAWHVARAPRPGSFDARIDIWLAPERQWYPARIRYTYPNADYLDMSLSSVTPIGAH